MVRSGAQVVEVGGWRGGGVGSGRNEEGVEGLHRARELN